MSESPKYCVRIRHQQGRVPKVFVDHPDLDPDAPHRYSDGSLCLFWPKEWTWSERASLADTLVMWAAFWLYYYEIWKLTGTWVGPSSSHGLSMKKSTHA